MCIVSWLTGKLGDSAENRFFLLLRTYYITCHSAYNGITSEVPKLSVCHTLTIILSI